MIETSNNKPTFNQRILKAWDKSTQMMPKAYYKTFKLLTYIIITEQLISINQDISL